MNDRYLFKAKRADNGEWVQGYYYQIWENGYILWGMTNDVIINFLTDNHLLLFPVQVPDS